MPVAFKLAIDVASIGRILNTAEARSAAEPSTNVAVPGKDMADQHASEITFHLTKGFMFEPATGFISVPSSSLQDGIEMEARHESADGTARLYTIALRYEPAKAEALLAAAPQRIISFGQAEALEALAVVTGSKPIEITHADAAARLFLGANGRVHTAWNGVTGDGLHRALMTLDGGALPYIVDRRAGISVRVRRVGTDWHGLRLETFPTQSGKKRLHLREYTGNGGNTLQHVTVPADWDWKLPLWIEMEAVGNRVRGRIHPSGTPAPDWQIDAVVKETAGGAFGPHVFAAQGLSWTVDLHRLEFLPRGASAHG
jgi:hypothetical protein